MWGKPRVRFWIETALAILSLALFIATLVSREWIELLFGVDPDGGSGALEWGLVVFFLVAFLAFAALGRAEWKRQFATESR